jgi:F420-dependent oxidoreductase-like protein
MIEIALMIEGQDGLNWERWQKIARVAEDAGYVGLYRSDHFTNPQGPYKDSLECWTSLAWLASHTSRLEFGPLVSPVSFRHPSMLVRMAAAVDDLSGGRLQFGVGAGWQDREHDNYGYDLGNVGIRSARLREAVRIIAHLLRSDEPLTFDGKFYSVREAVLLPRPRRTGGPPLVIGGSGRKLSLPLVARFADEWNTAYRTPEQFAELSAFLDTLLDAEGRPRSSVRRTLMTGVRFGRDQAALDARLAGRAIPEFLQRGMIVGTPGGVRDQAAALEAAGVQRVMLQWLDLDDVEGIAGLGRALIN